MAKHQKPAGRLGRQAPAEPPPAIPGETPIKTPVETPVQMEADASVRPSAGFSIVGIGASAGGLAAFEAFFAAMPADAENGMAVVLVQHLAPDHKSLLSELVKRYTRMQVFEVEDGMAVQPNCAYIIPPNRDMALLDGKLHLLEQTTQRGLRLPIDYFFRSLAQDQHERAICIVLSGTGSDGAQGVRAVKGEGGMAMAQTPDSTEYDGMPRSAIATGLVDYVLTPAEMPAQIIAYNQQAFGKKPGPISRSLPHAEDALNKIFILLRAQTGHDFSHYKQNTIARRVERRMAVQQIEQIDEYVRYLQQSSAEVEALFRDLLIGVTRFFRDPEAFAALKTEGIPRLFASKEVGAGVRVWVPGCSTGEEAYSIAILLQEEMHARQQRFQVQIFATDIDVQAIEQARRGIYPAGIAADVSPERLARFFVQHQDGAAYRIQKDIRDMLVISEQDVIQSPPFLRLDLISCRNLLIYMGGELQKKLIPLFHYALNPHGLLFLGNSETVGDFVHLFAALDRKVKLYQRQEDVPGALRPALGHLLSPIKAGGQVPRPVEKEQPTSHPSPRELAERTLLQEYAPVSVLVNAQGDIHYIHGRTGRYLEPAPGEANLNILSMAREGLQQALATALHKAAASRAPVRYPGLQVRTNGDFVTVNLTVRPMAVSPGATTPEFYLVVLEETPAAALAPAAPVAGEGQDPRDDAGAARIAGLEQALQDKEEYLRATREEMESANEELQSTNEEMQSVNEELQSTNEELETSKEELQSLNEELATINAELQQKVADLSQASNDMYNLMAATGVGTIFVDEHLRIQRFTLAATQLIHLIQTDVGRPVGDLASNLVGYDSLVADAQAVLDSLAQKEIEVQTQAGVWYLLSIRPYRTLENVIAGVVITFVDITRTKKAEALSRLAVVVHDAHDAITLQDLQGRILAWNKAAERTYGWSEAEALAMNIRDMVPENQRAHASAIVQRLSWSELLEPYRTQRLAKDGRSVAVWITATTLVNGSGEVYAIATTEREIVGPIPPEGQ